MIKQQTKNSIIDDVQSNIQFYSSLQRSCIIIERMTGITNQTYKISSKNKQIPSLIYRRFGQSETNLFLDRGTQKIIYQHVSQQQLGPKIYCYIGENIRIEEYIQCSVLDSKKMLELEVIQNVAYTLKKFHQMHDIEEIQRKSLFKKVFIEKIDELMKICYEKMDKKGLYNQKESQLIQMFRKQWISKQQIKYLSSIIQQLQSEPLVFSHNDLLANNIIIKSSSNKYIFIDYEYSTYNYPIYDITNYFNQSQYNYDVSQQPYFKLNPIKENIEQLHKHFIECYFLSQNKKQEQFKNSLKSKQEKEKVKEKVHKMMRQLNLGYMLCNIMWGYWAVIVSKNQNIKFDYLEFAKVRYDKYYQYKQKYNQQLNKNKQ